MLELHVGRIGFVDVGRNLLPEHTSAHDVMLLGRVDEVSAFAREVESDLGDPLDLVRGVNLGIDGAPLAVFQRDDFLGLAEKTPPVSSRTIMMSRPSTSSRFRLEASASAG